MNAVFSRGLCVAGAQALLLANGSAQERPANDPRVGLKPGLKDAGAAAKNMELLANLPTPPGFFDPAQPTGEPTEAEKPATAEKPGEKPADEGTAKPERPRSSLDFANSDLAFKGQHLFIGNFSGFNIYDVSKATDPKLITSVLCPGGQGDVSVHGNLLIMSVEQTRGRIDCGTQGVKETVSPERFRGVRIFDISDLQKPKQVASVPTCRGSHTHTLRVDP